MRSRFHAKYTPHSSIKGPLYEDTLILLHIFISISENPEKNYLYTQCDSIKPKSSFLFWLLDMSIICQHVRRLEFREKAVNLGDKKSIPKKKQVHFVRYKIFVKPNFFCLFFFRRLHIFFQNRSKVFFFFVALINLSRNMFNVFLMVTSPSRYE